MRTITIAEESKGTFLADDFNVSGHPPIGRGGTPIEAIARWVIANQSELGLTFDLDKTAQNWVDKDLKRQLKTR